MGDIEEMRTTHIEQLNDEDKTTFIIFQYRFPKISERVATTTAVTYIIFMLVLSSIIFIMGLMNPDGVISEAYTLLLIVIAFVYLSYLIIDIHLKKHRKNNFNSYIFINDAHSNFIYLKMGASFFFLGLFVHSSISVIYEVALLQTECASIFLVVFEILTPVFSLFILIFIIKYLNMSIHHNTILARFAIMHCIGTLITIGLYNIMSEAIESIEGAHYSRRITCDEPQAINVLYKSSAPYFYPFIIEFCILQAGIFIMLWFRIGKVSPTTSLKANHEIHIDCSQSHRGLLSGFILITSTICFIILSYVMAAERDYLNVGPAGDEIFEFVVFLVMSAATIIAFVQTSRLSFAHADTTKIDDVLLFIGVPGVLTQCILCAIPAIFFGSTIRICNRVIQVIQVFLQTPFIVSRLRSHCHSPEELKNKPGRQCVTFLGIANVSLWIFYAFSNHGVETHMQRAAVYGDVVWGVLYYLTLPFVMFYRFHSSVCLVHIWKHTYVNKT